MCTVREISTGKETEADVVLSHGNEVAECQEKPRTSELKSHCLSSTHIFFPFTSSTLMI